MEMARRELVGASKLRFMRREDVRRQIKPLEDELH